MRPDQPVADLFELIKRRRSVRAFSRAPLSRRELSILLRYSAGITGRLDDQRARRAQPSGGARFPLEIYVMVLRAGEALPAGLYHYQVKTHELDVLWSRPFDEETVGRLFTYEWVKDAAVVILLTAVFWRNQCKYGERGYRYILIEAGHIGQNLYLVSEALGLKCCALGGTNDDAVEKLLDLDGITESMVYALALGR